MLTCDNFVFMCKQTLGICNSDNIIIRGLTSLNSHHIVIRDCQNVKVDGVKIIAPKNSPNNDTSNYPLTSLFLNLEYEQGTIASQLALAPETCGSNTLNADLGME